MCIDISRFDIKLTSSKIVSLLVLVVILSASAGDVFAKEEKPDNNGADKTSDKKIDASDPTKVYTYVGVGPKYIDYTNGETMLELRAAGNIGLSKNDMMFFGIGYGKHSGDTVPGSDTGVTNIRGRWFHLFDMDYTITSGYRGWASQIDLQIAGSLKGTDGQNTLSLGGLPAFGISKKWSVFLPMSLVNAWDKEFKVHNGVGLNVSPLLVYVPGDWWQGAGLQFWPSYTRFVSGELSGSGSGNLDVTILGKITPTVTWTVLLQQNYDKDLKTYRRDRDSGLKNDWNAFFNITTYL
ncbi:MAG: hypothetical protein ACC707_13305 [Thiohalomonadales bacterium]